MKPPAKRRKTSKYTYSEAETTWDHDKTTEATLDKNKSQAEKRGQDPEGDPQEDPHAEAQDPMPRGPTTKKPRLAQLDIRRFTKKDCEKEDQTEQAEHEHIAETVGERREQCKQENLESECDLEPMSRTNCVNQAVGDQAEPVCSKKHSSKASD